MLNSKSKAGTRYGASFFVDIASFYVDIVLFCVDITAICVDLSAKKKKAGIDTHFSSWNLMKLIDTLS